MSDRREFVHLRDADRTWEELESQWRVECEKLGEDFETYAEATFPVIRDAVKNPQPGSAHRKAGIFGLKLDGAYVAMCQINKAPIPNYTGPVMRVRFITLSPEYDLTDKSLNDYGSVLVRLLMVVLSLAKDDDEFACDVVKFHLRSQADKSFFATLGALLKEQDVFEEVETHGAWLHIKR